MNIITRIKNIIKVKIWLNNRTNLNQIGAVKNTIFILLFAIGVSYISATSIINAIQPQIGTSPPTPAEFVFTLMIGLPLIALFWFGSKLKG